MAELDTTSLQAQADKLLADVESASAAIDKLIDRNARTALNQAEYNRKFDALTARHRELSEKYEKVAAQLLDRENRIRSFKHFEASLDTLDPTSIEFIPFHWHILLDYATVTPGRRDGFRVEKRHQNQQSYLNGNYRIWGALYDFGMAKKILAFIFTQQRSI